MADSAPDVVDSNVSVELETVAGSDDAKAVEKEPLMQPCGRFELVQGRGPIALTRKARQGNIVFAKCGQHWFWAAVRRVHKKDFVVVGYTVQSFDKDKNTVEWECAPEDVTFEPPKVVRNMRAQAQLSVTTFSLLPLEAHPTYSNDDGVSLPGASSSHAPARTVPSAGDRERRKEAARDRIAALTERANEQADIAIATSSDEPISVARAHPCCEDLCRCVSTKNQPQILWAALAMVSFLGVMALLTVPQQQRGFCGQVEALPTYCCGGVPEYNSSTTCSQVYNDAPSGSKAVDGKCILRAADNVPGGGRGFWAMAMFAIIPGCIFAMVFFVAYLFYVLIPWSIPSKSHEVVCCVQSRLVPEAKQRFGYVEPFEDRGLPLQPVSCLCTLYLAYAVALLVVILSVVLHSALATSYEDVARTNTCGGPQATACMQLALTSAETGKCNADDMTRVSNICLLAFLIGSLLHVVLVVTYRYRERRVRRLSQKELREWMFRHRFRRSGNWRYCCCCCLFWPCCLDGVRIPVLSEYIEANEQYDEAMSHIQWAQQGLGYCGVECCDGAAEYSFCECLTCGACGGCGACDGCDGCDCGGCE